MSHNDLTAGKPLKPLKVLLWNVCYCMGWDGSKSDFKRWHRSVACRRTVSGGVSKEIEKHIAQMSPDVCCLLEVDKRVPLATDLKATYPNQTTEVKYAEHGPLKLMPFFRNRCNAILSRSPMPVHRHDFSEGSKRLVFEVDVAPSTSLWVVHLALGKTERAEQIAELAQRMIPSRKHLVVGDFNAFRGTVETLPLVEAGLELLDPEPTYPAAHPKLSLDLVLHSKGLRVERIPTATPFMDSDHLPVCVNIWNQY